MSRENSRRSFIGALGMGATGWLAMKSVKGMDVEQGLHLACSEYPWIVFYRRENRDFRQDLDTGLGEVAAAGFDGYEPLIESVKELDRLSPLLEKHSLEMRSLYVNSVLHEADEVERSLELVLAIAEEAKKLGTRIIVTNPSPLQWGGARDKNDGQLETQAAALDLLGGELKKMEQILSYHNHDTELRQAARELHHMLIGTSPDRVTFCLDAHWLYRGAGNSSVALFDLLKLYAPRVAELHIRQSVKGVWSESFDKGDIDYSRLVEELQRMGRYPHLVLEQAVEEESPQSMNALEAHRKSEAAARQVFMDLAKPSIL